MIVHDTNEIGPSKKNQSEVILKSEKLKKKKNQESIL